MAENRIVTMKDGREVDFGLRGKLKKTIEISGEGKDRKVNISVDCLNGDTHLMEFNADDPLFFEYAAHGVSQKITDSIIKADDVSFGVSNQIAQLMSGKWSVRSTSNTIRGFSDMLEALRRIKKIEVDTEQYETLKVNLAAKEESYFKLMKTNPGVQSVLATISAEKAALRAKKLTENSGDTDLGELDI